MNVAFSNFAERLLAWIQSLPRTSIGDAHNIPFNSYALELFRLQFEALPAYRRFCEHRSVTPSSIDSWEAIPAMPTEAFKSGDLSNVPHEARAREFRSSGTGQDGTSRHVHSAQSLHLYETSVAEGYRCLGDAPQTPNRIRILSLTPPPQTVPFSSLAHMFGTLSREFGDARSEFLGRLETSSTDTSQRNWNVDPIRIERALKAAQTDVAPVALFGTAFQFVQWLDSQSQPLQGSHPLPPGSFVLETGGYKGRTRELSRSDLHSTLANHFSIPLESIRSEYGMCELSSQAYSRISTSREVSETSFGEFQFPPWARVRVMSPETGRLAKPGEAGVIHVVDLANVWSIAAIETADLGLKLADSFQLLGRVRSAPARGCSLLSADTMERSIARTASLLNANA